MYLLFDIGGTHTRIAKSDGENILDYAVVSTPQDFNEAILLLKQNAKQIVNGQNIDKACGGIACTLNGDKSVCTVAANLPGWSGKSIKSRFEEALGAPVYLQNDAALGALGEATFGAGKNYKRVGFLTIGTGVGGALIVDGKLDEESAGFEPGHNIFIEGKELEDLISGPAIKGKYGNSPNWDEICKYLEIGLKSLLEKWSPDVFILGGGVLDSLPMDKIDIGIPIVKASLKDKSGLYGALWYLKLFL